MPTPREEYIALCDDYYFNQIPKELFRRDLIEILRKMNDVDLLWVAGQSSMKESNDEQGRD